MRDRPSLTTFPSLTAITGEFCRAKIEVARCEPESIGIAAFAPCTLRVANLSTPSSAYLAFAATGNRPCTNPDNAPTSPEGIPPINFARNNTDCTYQDAWLYANTACPMLLDAPAACKYRAALNTASTGLYGSATPSPFASVPHRCHVDGKNCIHPTAPAEEILRFRP